MNDYDQRTAALRQFLESPAFGNVAKASAMLPGWLTATQGIPTAQLERACAELASTWKKTKSPKPGDLLAAADQHHVTASEAGGAIELELGQVFARARRRLEHFELPVTQEQLLYTVRSLLRHKKMRLTQQAYRDAYAQRILSSHELPFFVPPWTRSSQRHAVRQLSALAKACFLWCDEKRRFVPKWEAIDLRIVAERRGEPYPAEPTPDQIREGFEALERGELQAVEKPPRTQTPVMGMTPIGNHQSALDAFEDL